MKTKRTFLPLAKNYTNQNIGGYYCSEKLDGERCFWDGGITRGQPVEEVPWTNLLKEDRFVLPRIATGLWTRYGHPIMAPDWWINNLPNIPLDGELYIDRKMFQLLISTTRKLVPNDYEWKKVRYFVFDAPTYDEVFQDGQVNEPNYIKYLHLGMLGDYAEKLALTVSRHYESKWLYLQRKIVDNDSVVLHHQEKLSYDELKARARVEERLSEVLGAGGEGLMLKNSNSFWVPTRNENLLKVKDLQDSEAIVVGYKSGELGKLHGMMGSLIVQFDRVQFELSGFTDEERTLKEDAASWAISNPGSTIPLSFKHANPTFPLGSKVTFKYRELTRDGIPREARYWRPHR